MANFDESKHPRDDDGKFTDGNGSQWTTSKRDYSNVQGGEAQRVFDEAKQLGIDTKGIDNLDVIKARIAEKKRLQSSDESDKIITEDVQKFYNEIRNGKRFTYEELLKNPIIKDFEKKAQDAEKLAKQKPPISNEAKAQYSEKFLQGAKNAPKQYRADIVMGLPAAGKSSAVVNSLKDKYGSFEFDNDEIKKLLPGYNEYGAAYVHNDSQAVQKYAMKSFEQSGALNGANLAIPIIGSKVDSVDAKWITPLREAGYDIHIHYVGISNEESMNRMVGRAIKTGRYIPLHIIDGYGEKPKAVYEQLKKEGRKGVTFE